MLCLHIFGTGIIALDACHFSVRQTSLLLISSIRRQIHIQSEKCQSALFHITRLDIMFHQHKGSGKEQFFTAPFNRSTLIVLTDAPGHYLTIRHTTNKLFPFIELTTIFILSFAVSTQGAPGNSGISNMDTAMPHSLTSHQIQS